MRILVAGGGQVGALIARRLIREGNEVTIVDPSPDRCAELESQLDARVVAGNAARILTLRRAGVGRAEMVIAVSDQDEVNLLVCQLAQVEAPAAIKVLRLRTHEVAQWPDALARAGVKVDLIIHPETELAALIMRVIRRPGVSDIHEFAGGAVRLVGMAIEAGNRVIGRSLEQLAKDGPPEDALVGMIFRGPQVVIPRGSEILLEGDRVYVVTSRASLDRTLRFMGLPAPTPLKRVFITGGGQLGIQVAQDLEKQGVQVKLFERDPRRAGRISEILEEAVVINADGTDQATLEDAGIADAGAFLAVTKDDEDNIIASLLARRLGVPKVVALINRLNYLSMVQRLGINTTVSPRLAAADRILQFARRGRVLSVTTFRDEEAEAIELLAGADSKYVGKPLRDVRFPHGAVVGALAKPSGDVVIPRGHTIVEPGDRLIVFALESVVPALERAFLATGNRSTR
ncbi:MAG: Trk system potassium transporter TrkA [Acidobacteriota bacterium]